MYPLQVTFYTNALTKPDQLRQRVSFALQQIFVASGLMVNQPSWMAPYLQIFDKNAFGNFRQLLNDITLNPAMGEYLNMAGNNKSAPNENYGREVLQLFTIGLNRLNPDGSVVLDTSGNPVPAYTQPIVDAFARVFTGWNLAPPQVAGVPDYITPMVLTPANHDGGAKTLLSGVTLPAVTTVTAASASKDLSDALDNIFNHPNVGPFIGRNLIEHLVTSNPTPAYIARVTAAFNGTGTYGTGVRGDMTSVIRAILLDPEARNATPDTNFGHLQEPVLFISRFLRTFDTDATTTDFVLGDSFLPTELIMGEDLFRSPSVFNFYSPSFPVESLNGPEFSLLSTATTIARDNFIAETTFKTMSTSQPNRPTGTWLNLNATSPAVLNATSPTAILNYLNTVMMHGQMSPDLHTSLFWSLTAMGKPTAMALAQRAIYLVGSSPEYSIER